VLSEFINRYARLEHQIQKAQGAAADFKAFRKTPAFQNVAQNIAADVRRILKYCQRVESGFKTVDIIGLITDYEKGASDFNDQVLAALCRSKGLILVTHDADFKDCGLTIITANRELLT
jgi:predicted nucleic acid-binding protein